MFPIRDTIPSRHPPRTTLLLIAANLLVFVYELRLPPADLEELVHLYGLVPARFTDPRWASSLGFPAGGWETFLTSMFLHGGLLHFLGNMWTLWIFGDNVEDRMGSWRFLAFYLASGLLAGGTHWLTNAESTVPTIGASGAIAGVLGAYWLLFPRARVVTLVPIFFYVTFIELPAVVYMAIWFLTQLFSGVAALAGPQALGGVAWWAHIGGFCGGLLLYRMFLRRRRAADPRRAA